LGDRDLVAEAFSRFSESAWQALPSFSGRASLRVWTFAIARNSAADELRDRYRDRRVLAGWDTTRAHQVAERVRTATLEYEKTVNKNRLSTLREQLEVEDRSLLFLRVDQRMSWDEIAATFLHAESSSPEALKREAARLRKRFQLVKDRLHELAKAAGIAPGED
jgi:RNA polymerase sigma-70 factor (ECF subfamily)